VGRTSADARAHPRQTVGVGTGAGFVTFDLGMLDEKRMVDALDEAQHRRQQYGMDVWQNAAPVKFLQP
jgi:hypothetical protein